MDVTVWGLISENASGHIVFNLRPSYRIGDLLQLYCTEKGINVAHDYVLCGRKNASLDPSKSLSEAGIANGEVLMLTQKGKNEHLFSFGNWWLATILALAFGGLGISYVLYLFFAPISTPQKSAIVIDAGSSHSQLFVFSWTLKNSQGVANIELKHDCFMAGGVTDFRSNPKGIANYFMPCIKEAESFIPVSNQPKTPLVLAATAGMRLLRAYDPEGAELILSSIREVIKSKTNFLTTVTDVFIATGQQEGINGWTALNYLLETFQEVDDEPVSALDLGGASVQVTTVMSKKTNRWPSVNITIFNNTYRVFSKSFLCYGIGEALHRYEYLLVNSEESSEGRKNQARAINSPDGVIENPCLPKGFSTTFSAEDFSDPCVYSNRTSADLPLNATTTHRNLMKYLLKYPTDIGSNGAATGTVRGSAGSNTGYSGPTSESDGFLYYLKGSSDMTKCRRNVRSLFDFELCNKTFLFGSCLKKEIVPPYAGELVGFSDVFLRLLQLLHVPQESSLEDFREAVLRTCSLTAEEIKIEHPDISKELLQDLCFDSMYVYTLLTDGLGITAERWKNILFVNKVHQQDVAWVMGLFLNRTSSLPSEATLSRIDLTPFILLLLLFSSFFMTAAMFFYNAFRMRRQKTSYQRVLNEYATKREDL